MNNGRATPLITSVCYVRLAVSEPGASARFMSDIFGLQRVAGHVFGDALPAGSSTPTP